MFHYFQWKVEKKGWVTLLIHDFIWIQVFYAWKKSEWEFYLFSVYDENKKTIQYYAFDTLEQKQVFEQFLKVNWIWGKTAFQLAQTPYEELSNAVKNMDVKFFQAIPWIWTKWAKKILLELKDSFDVKELSSLDIDQKLFKDIVKSMRDFWYDADSVKKILLTYKEPITKEKMPEIIKWIISQL
jgi:Holliday junction resolvasome RuvABC DNA-binding subunit